MQVYVPELKKYLIVGFGNSFVTGGLGSPRRDPCAVHSLLILHLVLIGRKHVLLSL